MRWQFAVALVGKTDMHAGECTGQAGLSRPPPEMTVRGELGGRLWAWPHG